MASMFTVEVGRSHDMGLCPCCGCMSRLVQGLVQMAEMTVAVYFVHWTIGHVDTDGAHFDLIVGLWGEGVRDEDRLSVSLEYRIVDGVPSFMIIDARPRIFAQQSIAGVALDRSKVIGTDLAPAAFAMVDAIMAGDDRVVDLLPGRSGQADASHQVQ